MICDIKLSDNVDINTTALFEWKKGDISLKNSTTHINPINLSSSAIFEIKSLKLSDAATYTCHVNVSSNSPFVLSIKTSDSIDVRVIGKLLQLYCVYLYTNTVPDIIVIISSVEPYYNTGTNINLTCNVTLNDTYNIVDEIITANFEWINKQELLKNYTTTLSPNNLPQSSLLQLYNLNVSNTGVYTCLVTVSKKPHFIIGRNATANVKLTVIGKYLIISFSLLE